MYSFNFIAITNDPSKAEVLDSAGIQQIMVDCEIIGKVDRQAGKNTIISDHQIADITKLKELNLSAQIICRINPYHYNTEAEINEAIERKVDKLMIPMINNIEDYHKILKIVADRVEVIPLIETPYSIFKIDEIFSLNDIQQVHFGLNDLYLGLGMKNLFEVLTSHIFQEAIRYSADNSEMTGFGGIGNPKINQTVNPLSILNEHIHLGSKSVILSRSFFNEIYDLAEIVSSLELFDDFIQGDKDYSFYNDILKNGIKHL